LDEESGLYYYNARYYDPELGRFIQPDTMVPDAGDPQTLNRYSYVNNNPLKYADPSGHFAFLAAIPIGAAIGGATAAAPGGNILMGMLTGGLGGAFAGLGVLAGGSSLWGSFAGAVGGGALGGAVIAGITGGNIGMGALTGAISGAIG
jgi:RHS repeat-associated protein